MKRGVRITQLLVGVFLPSLAVVPAAFFLVFLAAPVLGLVIWVLGLSDEGQVQFMRAVLFGGVAAGIVGAQVHGWRQERLQMTPQENTIVLLAFAIYGAAPSTSPSRTSGPSLAHAVQCRSAVIDGEIACFEPDGRSHFYNLLFRREWPHFMAFDLLALDWTDLRNRPLHERKLILKAIMPRVESRVRLVEAVEWRGVDFFRAACAHDLTTAVVTRHSRTMSERD